MSAQSIQDSISANRIEVANINGSEKLVYFSKVPNTNWTFAVEMTKETEEAAHSALLREIILLSIVLTVIVAVGVTTLVNLLFRDLIRVSDALAEISSGEGDLTQRLEPHSDDEVGQLAINFNTFVGNMHSMVCRLRDISVTLANQANSTAEERKNVMFVSNIKWMKSIWLQLRLMKWQQRHKRLRVMLIIPLKQLKKP